MIIRIFMMVLISAFCSAAYADSGNKISGYIKDYLTNEAIHDVTIVLLNADSTVVDSAKSIKSAINNRSSSEFSITAPAQRGEFILKFVHPKYTTQYKSIRVNTLKRALFNSANAGTIYLHKKPKERTLQAATIKVTKLKFFHRGDTIVYNADAFNLAKGSMLDALIAELPGTRINEDGQIYVQGEFVDELLLNGKHFFQNNRNVLLENLPAYMVRNIKTYHKEDKRTANRRQKYVMDVILKREYTTGWTANSDLARGTDDRYSVRLFGLSFNQRSRISAYANINNINNTHKPGKTGEWTAGNVLKGACTNRNGGFDYMLEDKKTQFHSSNEIHNYQNNLNMDGNSRLFLQQEIFGISQSRQRTTSTNLTTNNEIVHMRDNEREWFIGNLNIHYHDGHSSQTSQSIETLMPLDSVNNTSLWSGLNENKIRSSFLNHNTFAQVTDEYSFNTEASLSYHNTTVPTAPDFLDGMVTARYNKDHFKSFSQQRVDYQLQPLNNDYRHQYTRTPKESYSIETEWKYNYTLRRFHLNPKYTYKHTYHDDDRTLFSLNRIEGWAEPEKRKLEELPSTFDSLQIAVDAQNSYYSSTTDDEHRIALSLIGENKAIKNLTYGMIDIPVRIVSNKLDYQRASNIITKHRTLVFFEPMVSIQWKYLYFFKYALRKSAPSQVRLIDITDDANPLFISRGNPNLRNTDTHTMEISYKKSSIANYTGLFSATINYNLIKNALGFETLYNTETGVCTSSPVNVNGNWSTSATIAWGRAIDKAKKDKWHLDTYTEYLYNHNVDLIGMNNRSLRSVVHNYTAKEEATLKYKQGQNHCGIKGRVVWTNIASARENFNTMNVIDFSYGATALWQLPWKLELGTDLMMYCHRGYESREMNTNDLVWNARLSRNFNEHFSCTIEGFDILGNLSNVVRSVNAQGRTETRYNVVPHYAMLHLLYRISVKPKK